MKKIIFFLLLMLIGCSSQATQETVLVPEIPREELNTKIALKESLGMKDIYDAMGAIVLNLNNLSDGPVLFPSNFNTEIYVQHDMNWKKVDNIFGYPNGDNVLPTTKEFPAGLIVPVAPDLTQFTTRPITLRIIVTGTMQNSAQEVGAYIDVTIE